MSDMQKWINLCESHRPGGQVVQISQNQGGGVGKFVKYSNSGTSAMVEVKGEMREYAVEDLEDPIEGYYDGELDRSAQRYAEKESGNHYLPDKPELQPGETVEISDIYGSGNGAGYGVFVAYSLDGTSAIINFDGSDRSVPVDAINKAPEEQSEENFASTGNDGSMSPMSTAGDNVDDIRIGESKMDEFEKWVSICETADEEEVEVSVDVEVEKGEDEKVDEGVCGCNSHACLSCFPATQTVVKENEIFDEVLDIMEMDDDYDEPMYNDDGEEVDSSGRTAAEWDDDRHEKGYMGRKSAMDENPELDAIPDNGGDQSGPMDPNMGQGMLPADGMQGEPEVMVVTPDGAGLEEPCCDGDPRLEPEMDSGPDTEVMDLLARLQDILGAGAGGGMAEIPPMGGGVAPGGEEVVLQMGESDLAEASPETSLMKKKLKQMGVGNYSNEQFQLLMKTAADYGYNIASLDHDSLRELIDDTVMFPQMDDFHATDSDIDSLSSEFDNDDMYGAYESKDEDEDEEAIEEKKSEHKGSRANKFDESGKPWEDDDKEEVDEEDEDEDDAIEEGQVDPIVAEWMARLARQ